MTAEVLVENKGPIGIITFNRPDRGNALTVGMAKLLSEKLKPIVDDRSIRVVLMRGAGNAFMEGYEVSPLSACDANAIQEQAFHNVHCFYTAIREIQLMEKPVVASVKGRVAGAGLSCLLAADLVIAAKSSQFSNSVYGHSMVVDGGTTFLLPRKIGLSRANEMTLIDEPISAQKALEWGLINRIVDDEALETETFALTEKLASGPTRVMGMSKRLFGKAFEHDLGGQLSEEAAAWMGGAKTFDFREAMKAYAAKRPPKYTGA